MFSRRMLLIGTAGGALGGLVGCSPGASDPGTTTPTPELPEATPSPEPRPSTPSPTPSPTPAASPRPKLAGTVVDNLDVPWGLIFTPAGDALLSERNTGRVLKITGAGKITTLGEVAGVQAPSGSGEGGLLGLALDRDDEEVLYAYLTSSSDNRVVRLSLAGGRVGRPRPILTGIPASTHHNGGALRFAADGTLLVATGDAEQSGLAQRRGSLAGKILRIRTDGRAAPDNPFDNRTWSYGHRNVEGLAFDGGGRLWATEFGEKAADELNLIVRGRNYGWPSVEGRSADDRFESPKVVWSPTSTASPAGLAITRSTAFVGALQGQCLFSVPLDGISAGRPRAYFAGDHGRIRTVAVAPDGSLWITTSNTDGRRDPGRDDDKILRVTL